MLLRFVIQCSNKDSMVCYVLISSNLLVFIVPPGCERIHQHGHNNAPYAIPDRLARHDQPVGQFIALTELGRTARRLDLLRKRIQAFRAALVHHGLALSHD
jgi:hypothetical protein